MHIKPSLLWTIVATIALFFMLNHWMSCEIKIPAPAKPAVQQTPPAEEKTVFEQPPQTEPFPGVPIDEKIVQPEVAPVKKTFPSRQEDDGTHEPIYEAPGNSTVLVQ
ncbi:MAG: hypothetical protein KA403_01900 [Candidatus Omnitrophica bacterium]|nr:hypothetical protein [Candidatus Omnitrophota bacterium]